MPVLSPQVRYEEVSGPGFLAVRGQSSTLMRHLFSIGGGPIRVAAAYIKRFSNPTKSSAAN
jgi:hypothetical protein